METMFMQNFGGKTEYYSIFESGLLSKTFLNSMSKSVNTALRMISLRGLQNL